MATMKRRLMYHNTGVQAPYSVHWQLRHARLVQYRSQCEPNAQVTFWQTGAEPQ
jgi:hypothetical protein